MQRAEVCRDHPRMSPILGPVMGVTQLDQRERVVAKEHGLRSRAKKDSQSVLEFEQ